MLFRLISYSKKNKALATPCHLDAKNIQQSESVIKPVLFSCVMMGSPVGHKTSTALWRLMQSIPIMLKKFKKDGTNSHWTTHACYRGHIYIWLNEWLNDCMNDWVNEWMNEWMNDCMNEWMNDCMNDWVNEWMNERLHEWLSQWMNEWMNEWMNDCMNDCVNEWINEWMNDCMNEWMNERTNENINNCSMFTTDDSTVRVMYMY